MSDATRLTTALADRYSILREIGAGGMATVYLARDLKHDREVALKVLRPELGAVLGAERFLAEIRITARLDHPHILTLIDSGESEGFLWYVLPYVRGESLRDLLNRERQLGLDQALAITRQVAGALEFAHRQGVVHRDIKPENILLQEGEAMLADFGIALAVKEAGGNRLTETGLSLGTPQYMSPEQATGDRTLDARSDVYSLAAVLYEMLAGEPPVTGPTVQAVIAKLLTERPTHLRVVRDTVPEGIDSAVAKALSKVPADRFTGAGAFAAALAAPAATAAAPGSRRRPRLMVAIVAVAMVAVVAALKLMPNRAVGSGAPLASGPRTQLTFTGSADVPSISADGLRLAYSQRDCAANGLCTASLVVRDLGGAGEVRPVTGFAGIYWIRWSPDGRYLLIQGTSDEGRYGTFLVPAIGGSPARYLSASFGSFGSFAGGGDAVLVVQPAADSTSLLRWIALDDGRTTDSLLVNRSLFAAFTSPDDRWLGLVGPVFYIANRDGTPTDSLTGDILAVEWGPDGRLYLALTDSGNTGLASVVRRSIDERGRLTPEVELVLPGQRIRAVQVTAAGVVYSSGPVENTILAGVRPDPAGARTTVRTLTAATSELRAELSGSGERLVLVRPEAAASGQRMRMFMLPFEGGPEVPVSPPLSELWHVEWTVDGRRLFYLDRDRGQVRIMEANPSGGASTLVAAVSDTTRPIDFEPLLSGGFLLVYETPRRLDLLGADGVLVRSVVARSLYPINVTESGHGDGVALWGWTWPHGDTLVVANYDVATGAITRRLEIVREGVRGFHWLPGGVLELAMEETEHSTALYHLNMRTGQLRRIAPLTLNGGSMTFSNDGRRVVIRQPEARTDIWLARFAELP